MANGEPRTAEEWSAACTRFMAEGDRVLATGLRRIAYDQYGYAVEAAAKACVVRRVLGQWPLPGEDQARQVHTHNVAVLLKFAGIFEQFAQDRQHDGMLRNHWLVVKEWFPGRYSMQEPDHRSTVRMARAAKQLVEWLDRQ